MKRFSDFRVKKIYEDEITLKVEDPATTPDNTEPANSNVTPNITTDVTNGAPADVVAVTAQAEVKPQEQKQEEVVENCASKFFSKLFESREMAHVYHLSVKGDEGSYAAHMALSSYYDSVIEFIDDIIETYQGQYGLIEDYETIDTKETKTKDRLQYFEELVISVKEERKCISAEDTHLQNIIDEIVALIYKTIYKLKFNK